MNVLQNVSSYFQNFFLWEIFHHIFSDFLTVIVGNDRFREFGRKCRETVKNVGFDLEGTKIRI